MKNIGSSPFHFLSIHALFKFTDFCPYKMSIELKSNKAGSLFIVVENAADYDKNLRKRRILGSY